MNVLDRWLLRPLVWLGAALVFAMMVLTFVDVVGRYFFNAPTATELQAAFIQIANNLSSLHLSK